MGHLYHGYVKEPVISWFLTWIANKQSIATGQSAPKISPSAPGPRTDATPSEAVTSKHGFVKILWKNGWFVGFYPWKIAISWIFIGNPPIIFYKWGFIAWKITCNTMNGGFSIAMFDNWRVIKFFFWAVKSQVGHLWSCFHPSPYDMCCQNMMLNKWSEGGTNMFQTSSNCEASKNPSSQGISPGCGVLGIPWKSWSSVANSNTFSRWKHRWVDDHCFRVRVARWYWG